jgi:hypothetical protein
MPIVECWNCQFQYRPSTTPIRIIADFKIELDPDPTKPLGGKVSTCPKCGAQNKS